MQELIHRISENLNFLIGQGRVHFLEDAKLELTMRSNCWDAQLRVVDITNALKRGEICETITVTFPHAKFEGCDGLDAMLRFIDKFQAVGFRVMLQELLAMPWQAGQWGCFAPIAQGGSTFNRSQKAGMRTYSPFAELPRLKALPAKWTVAHVVRALWNGQFSDLKCRRILTDDYAGDAAGNFGKGAIRDARAFAKDLIESPSGWWASDNRDSKAISICCHSFNSNEFVPDLDGVLSTPAPETVAA